MIVICDTEVENLLSWAAHEEYKGGFRWHDGKAISKF